MGFLGGGGSGNAKSGNHAWGAIERIYKPMAEKGVGGFNAFGDILGLGAPGAGSQALDDYYNSSGGKFLLDQGLDGLTNKFTQLGLSKSGPAMKGMETFRQDLASTKLDNYLGHLAQYSGMGLGAGGLMANAGQYSKGTGQTQGLGGLIGQLAVGLAAGCDRRLKRDIVLVGKRDGIPEYDFTYRQDTPLNLPTGRFRGVMADDVAKVRPEALGPVIHGFATISDPSLFPQRIAA